MLLEKLRKIGEGLLAHSHEALAAKQFRTQEMDAIMKALDTFKDSVGVLELQSKLRTWMTQHNKILAYGDFRHFAQESAAAQVADLQELEKLLTKCSNVPMPKEDPAFILMVVRLANNALSAIFTQASYYVKNCSVCCCCFNV